MRKVLEQREPEVISDDLLRPGESETVRSLSERLLMHVFRVDPADGRTVGLMYKTILGFVLGKIPSARTKISGLRWYAVHLRERGNKLPQKRPRPPHG